MHISVLSAALLALPAALASPLVTPAALQARATVTPTCNANNVALFKKDITTTKTFCSKWQATATHSLSPVTGLAISQISNICKCILAPTYVASPALSTSSASTTSSVSKTSSASKTSSTTSSTVTPTCNANNVALFKKDITTTKTFCSKWQATATHSISPVTGLAISQISNICKCVLAPTYVASPALSTSSTASRTSSSSISSSTSSSVSSSSVSSSSSSSSLSSSSSSSSKSSSSSSSSSSISSTSTSSSTSSSSSTSTSTAVPSSFSVYVGAVSATTGGSALQASATSDVIGLFATPTPYIPVSSGKKRSVEERDTATASVSSDCTAGRSYVHGTEFYSVCNTTTSDSAAGTTYQPTTLDNITTMAECIYFCDEQGSACGGIVFTQDPATGDQPCSLISTIKTSNFAASTTLVHVAYKAAEVPTLSFNFDPSSGYVYANGYSDIVLGGLGVSGGLEDISLVSVDDDPLVCAVDAQLRMTCKDPSSTVTYAATNLTLPDASTGVQTLNLRAGSSSKSTSGLYLVAANATDSSSSTYDYTNGNNTVLLVTNDFLNDLNTTAGGAVLNTTTGGLVNMWFDVDTAGDASSVLTVDDITLYAGDNYRFSASITFTYGHLPADIVCTASLSFTDGSDVADSIPFDPTFPTQFDIVWEGTTETTGTVPVSFEFSCAQTDAKATQSYAFPIAINSITFESDPTTATGATLDANSDGSVYVQYYSGNNTQLLTVSTDLEYTSSVLYVGSQAQAVTSCASAAGTEGAFEVYYSSAGAWNCFIFPEAYASASLFANADTGNTNVVGYYLSTLLSS